MYIAKRHDGTFETLVNELPYHVLQDDPLFADLSGQYRDLDPGFALLDGSVVEDNRGRAGWLGGEPFSMADFGPLPEGFSETPPVGTALATKLAEIMTAYDAAFAAIDAAYPAKERETWTIQLEEARAVLGNPDAETPMLSVMVAARGKQETVAEFARTIIANNDAYRLLAGGLTGQQQRMYAAVTAMAADGKSTAENILAYPVTYAMPDGI